LASALGYIGYGYIHGIERSKNKPTAELVLRMALLFNVSTDQLLRDELELDAGSENTASSDETL
jgi:transcriptional regulator with XRE-family HTH domain